jgi:histidine kinase
LKLDRTSMLYGTLILTGTSIVSQFLGFVYRILLSRLIGAEVMGLYQLIMPVFSVIMALTAVGLTVAVSNLSSQYHARGNRAAIAQVLRRCLAVFLLLFAAVAAVVVLLYDPISVYLLGDARTQLGLLLLLPCILLTGVENLHKHFFYGTGNIRPPAAVELCEQFIRTGAVLGLLVVFLPQNPERTVGLIVTGMILCELFSAVTLLLCAVSVALYWYEVRLPIGRMIASMQAMREGQAVTLDDARRDDEFGQLARAIVEFSIRNQHHLEEVRRRKDDFQRLFDMVPCGISVQDREYRLLRWNHSFAVRYDPQPGNTCYEVYKGRTTPCPECSVQRTWEEGAVQCNQESRVNPDGTRDYWFVQTVPLFDKDGNVSSVMEMSIDMTLIHTLQHQLQASERTHKAIFDSIPNAVFLLDAAELTILDCNPASVKMYGRQRENELIGRGILDLFLPEEREQYASQLRAFTVFSGVTNIKADGTPLRVDIRSASAMIENRRVRILCATDVTERIEMEQKFIQAGKMATLGEMATGVAHELNQPLTVIKGAASYFLRKTRRSEPIAPETLSELSVEISGQVDRASDIINHMRAFGRKSDLALLDTDINGVVAQACDLFGRQLVVHGITLETSLAPALPPVLAIPNRLEQVIVNLILNARDAVEERVKSAPEPPAVIGVSTVMDGNTVLLSVWDTGTGIPAHLLNKIFEPFFTTKPVGKGTGLGLSIIYGLVKDFGGSISARNRDEGGALFEIRLPITRRGDLAPNAPADGNRAGGVSGPQPEQIS